MNFAGREFYFGIPLSPSGQTTVFDVTIGTPFSQAGYVIESQDGEISSGTANSNNPSVIRLDRSLQVTQTGFQGRTKGIRVRATTQNSIYVLVIMKYNDFGFFQLLIGYDSFLVHPNNIEALSGGQYVYYAVSTEKTPDISDRNSNILLVGNHNETTISITPTQSVQLPQNAQTESTLVSVAASTTHNLTLNSFQTVLFSSILDLTGTKIVSNKPLTVITGHQCAQIPATTGFCEPIYIQLLPTFNWGQQFLLAPFSGRTANQYYRLVSSEASTTVTYNCGGENHMTLQAGRKLDLTFSPTSYCYLDASSPVLVVQMAPGHGEDSTGDPSMAIVAPTTGHIRSSSFINLPSDFSNSFITVTMLAEHFNTSQILLDGSPLPCTWSSIQNIRNENVGHGCSYSVSAGPHTVSHSGENGVLSVSVYGWNNSPDLGYAYLTDYNLGKECV